MIPKRPALTLALALTSCSGTKDPGPAVTIPTLASPTTATFSKPASRPAKRVDAGALPGPRADPASCKAAAARPGAWSPTVPEIRRFLSALSDSECAHEEAIASCVSRAASSEVELTFGKDTDAHACTLTVRPAIWNGRRWIVATKFFRDGSTFFSVTHVHEFRAGNFEIYLEGDTGQSPECGANGTMGTVSPEMKADFPRLPSDLQELFCKGA